VPTYGNLKSALKARDPDSASLTDISISFVGGRKCLVAVSTHEGEEAWLLEAARGIEPQPAIILIPRHPERREKIIRLLDERSFSYSVRSRGDAPSPAQDVLLADTLGEVGLFAKLADTVYLGGGHAPNVGGHNPVEILRLERPVMTGPDTFNFLDLNRGLEGDCGFKIVRRPEDLIASFPLPRPSAALIDRLEEQANEPMMRTVEALQKLLRRVTQ
jgi:3-deoxy-D-manno-octulosonic-acid transferase